MYIFILTAEDCYCGLLDLFISKSACLIPGYERPYETDGHPDNNDTDCLSQRAGTGKQITTTNILFVCVYIYIYIYMNGCYCCCCC